MRYRVTQFLFTLLASLSQPDVAYAKKHLAPPRVSLFLSMPRAEQHHGIAIARALEMQGYRSPHLLAAALLHDVGKTRAPLRIWDRVLVVLGEHFFPERAEAWSRGEPRGLRRGFVVRRKHPAWGADLTEETGASPRTVHLIRNHHLPPKDDEELKALQAVDEHYP
ncbi:MAG: HD domain-containing protein [Anaerolineae bacterium]